MKKHPLWSVSLLLPVFIVCLILTNYMYATRHTVSAPSNNDNDVSEKVKQVSVEPPVEKRDSLTHF